MIHILGIFTWYLVIRVSICSLLGVSSAPGSPTDAWYVGEFCRARVLKKKFKETISREYSSGGTPVSTQRLAAGEDLKAPVHALRHSFWIGSRRLSAFVSGVP